VKQHTATNQYTYNRTVENVPNEEIIATPQSTEGNYKLVTAKYVRDGKEVGEEMKKVPKKLFHMVTQEKEE